MFIVSGEKGSGKTRTLLEKAYAEGGVVVCTNPDAMRNRARGYGLIGLDTIAYGETSAAGKPVYIHDINKFIEYYMPNAAGYTLCID